MKRKLLFTVLITAVLLGGCGRSKTNTNENSSVAESQTEENNIAHTDEAHNTAETEEAHNAQTGEIANTGEVGTDLQTGENHDTAELDNTYNAAETQDMIGEEKAKQIALDHAGLTAEQVTFIKSGLDRDDGKLNYDVEFYDKDGKEYDYEIDPHSGQVLDYDHDAEYYGAVNEEVNLKTETGTTNADGKTDGADGTDKKDGTTDGKTADKNTGTDKAADKTGTNTDKTAGTNDAASDKTSTAKITADQALKIALEKVPGATSQDVREFKSDHDNGRLEYEGKIYYDKTEYEFEIDGETGKILEWDVEPIYGAVS